MFEEQEKYHDNIENMLQKLEADIRVNTQAREKHI